MFFLFLVVLFFVACVLVLVFCKKAQKGYFSAILEVFCLFCSHKRPVLRCFCSSYFVFFAFVFPFKTPFYPFAFWPSAPFWKTLIFLVSFFFLFLLFPFFMFACFFQTNFPNIPFLKSNLLSFLAVYFFCCSCFCFGCVCFSLSVFLLLCWLCFWCFFWFCFVFCFCLLSCFGSSLWKKAVFPFFVSACFADRPGSAEIRGFRLVFGIIGAQRWRVSDAAKQTIAIFAEIFSKMWIFFWTFVWYPWLRTIFLHRLAFLRKFSGAPVWGDGRKLDTKWCFWGVLSFCFGLNRLILLAAYLHDGWWRGCTRTTRRKKKTKSNQWQQFLVQFFWCLCLFLL